jgi:PAS domain S-box-containing protein
MKKILVIDDQRNNLIGIKAILEKSIPNCEVLTVQSGIEGLKIAKTKQPDTILLDIVMPEIDGYEVCKILKADEKTKSIPIILISAFQKDTESRIKGLKSGADVFLTKPINPAELSAQVSSMLRIRNAEKTIKESEEKYHNIVALAPIGFYQTAPNGSFLYANATFASILGYDDPEYFRNNININSIYFNKDDRKNLIAKYSGLGNSKIINFQVKLKKKNGSPIWVLLTSHAIKNKNGSTKYYNGFVIDITERKYTEQIQKVIFNISNAASISENVNELCKLIQDQLGTIIDATNFFVAMYDKETDIISLPYYSDKKDKYMSFPAGKTMTAYLIKNKKSILEKRDVITKLEQSGEVEPIGSKSKVWLGVPLKIGDEVIGAIVLQSYDDENAYTEKDKEMLELISHQISISIERKNAEQNLKAALEKAKESDRLKSTFLSTMSHELRTPLNAVIGFSELLISESNVDDEILEYGKMINISGDHLLALVEDIFDISLIETGEVKIEKEEFELNELIDDIQQKLIIEQKKIKKENIKIIYNPVEKDKKIFLNTDSLKIKQILFNLIKNALKFTHEGYIEFGFSKVMLKNKSMLKFYIKDTGIGISKDKQKIIFDIFRQGDESHTRKYEGAGIGLSVSYKLTELLGGEMWVESVEGTGSIFYFTIPYVNNFGVKLNNYI